MKFNLKNKPQLSDERTEIESLWKYHYDTQVWFEGFEKELRKRLTQLEQGKRKTDNAVVIASRLSLMYMIKEILGEN